MPTYTCMYISYYFLRLNSYGDMYCYLLSRKLEAISFLLLMFEHACLQSGCLTLLSGRLTVKEWGRIRSGWVRSILKRSKKKKNGRHKSYYYIWLFLYVLSFKITKKHKHCQFPHTCQQWGVWAFCFFKSVNSMN